MRHPVFALSLIGSALLCFAQPASVEPEIADIFYRLDNEKLVPLERQAAATKGGAHGFIVMSMKTAKEFPGAASPIRFKAGESMSFVVRSALPIGMVDPNTVYYLRKLGRKKSSRELVITNGHVTPFGSSITATPEEGVLPVEFTKWGVTSLKMDAGKLMFGEYAVGKPYGVAVFCFGVD